MLRRHSVHRCSKACVLDLPVPKVWQLALRQRVVERRARPLSCAAAQHPHQHHCDETPRSVVCATCPRCRGSSNRLSAANSGARCRRPTPRTATRRALGSMHSRSTRWRWRTEPAPGFARRFELALGEAMTALQLGNCDLVRLRGTSDGGEAARLCGPALARWRPVHAMCTAPSATTRRARRPDEAGNDTSPS